MEDDEEDGRSPSKVVVLRNRRLPNLSPLSLFPLPRPPFPSSSSFAFALAGASVSSSEKRDVIAGSGLGGGASSLVRGECASAWEGKYEYEKVGGWWNDE
jgi:hypothetical protein